MSPKGKQKGTKRKTPSSETKCIFCGLTERNVVKFGQTYKLNDIYVHYYCLLLSSGLIQNGVDTEGILGFLEVDIRKEHRRAAKLKCSYCREMGATIGCSVKTCKTQFHLVCGQQNKALNQFYGNFDSYCYKHRPRQTLSKNFEKNTECSICLTKVEFDKGFQVLDTPCCHKLFHRTCLQKQALSAGYLFKCPLCNNDDLFREDMNTFGLFVPKQDASWERDDNAFGELYQRYSRCDQEKCLCPEGRTHSTGSNDWQILRCDSCGSKGTHWKCVGNDDWIDAWICDECKAVEKRVNNNMSSDSGAMCSSDSDDESDIVVISESPPLNRVEESTRFRSASALRRANNSLFEFNVSGETPPNRKRFKRVETKDVAIQCTLVAIEDLVDSEPIPELDPYVLENSDITFASEVIDIEDSDDDCLLIN